MILSEEKLKMKKFVSFVFNIFY